MKFVRFALITLLSIFLVNQAIAATTPKPPANTFAVTPAGAALGFTITPIISSIPTTAQSFGILGATGIVAAKNGDIIVVSANDNVVRVYSNSDTINGARLKYTNTIVGINGSQLAILNGSIYARINSSIGTATSGSLVQLNDNGTLAKTIAANIPAGWPLVAAPALNSLIFGSNATGGFYLVTAPNGGNPYNALTPAPSFYQISTDPIGGTANMYFDCCSKSVYTEYLANLGRFSLSGMTLTQNLSVYIQGSPWDGSAYGIGKIGGTSTLNGQFVLNNRTDMIVIDPDTNIRTTIVSGGTQVGRSAAHQDGSFLVIQGGSIYKLRCTNCSFL